MDPLTTVEFFTGAKDFNIRNGRFRTIAGDSYTGCYPQSVLPVQERPPINSKTSFFSKSSNFEISGGEFMAINGDSVDFRPPFDVPGPNLNDGYDPNVSGSVPQAIGPQLGLDVPEDSPAHEQPEDIGQIMHVSNYTAASAEEGQKANNLAPPGVHIAQTFNDVDKFANSPPEIFHPENTDESNPPQGQTSRAVHPLADVDVEPALLTSPIAYRTTPTQSDSSRPVPIGDEGIPATNIQGGGSVLQLAEPHSYSEDANRLNASPRILSANLDVNGSEVHSPEEIRTSETNLPLRSRRLCNWIKNIVTTLWHRLRVVSYLNGTKT